jgi:tellurite resistance protein TehA-like permease
MRRKLNVMILPRKQLKSFAVRPNEVIHPYWINAGAVAISTVSGSILIEKINDLGIFIDFLPFVKGFTFLLWIIGTWCIPIVLILELWRYLIKKVPLKYNSNQWSMVFAIGMYGLATWHLEKFVQISNLTFYSKYVFFISLVLWSVSFFGMISGMLKKLFHK